MFNFSTFIPRCDESFTFADLKLTYLSNERVMIDHVRGKVMFSVLFVCSEEGEGPYPWTSRRTPSDWKAQVRRWSEEGLDIKDWAGRRVHP